MVNSVRQAIVASPFCNRLVRISTMLDARRGQKNSRIFGILVSLAVSVVNAPLLILQFW